MLAAVRSKDRHRLGSQAVMAGLSLAVSIADQVRRLGALLARPQEAVPRRTAQVQGDRMVSGVPAADEHVRVILLPSRRGRIALRWPQWLAVMATSAC